MCVCVCVCVCVCAPFLHGTQYGVGAAVLKGYGVCLCVCVCVCAPFLHGTQYGIGAAVCLRWWSEACIHLLCHTIGHGRTCARFVTALSIALVLRLYRVVECGMHLV